MKWTYLEKVHMACVKSNQTTLLEWECHSSTTRKTWSQICMHAKYKYLFIFSPLHSPLLNVLLLWCLNRTLRNLHCSSPLLFHIVTSGVRRLSVSVGWFSCPSCSCRKGFSNVPSKHSGSHLPIDVLRGDSQAPKGYLGFSDVVLLS